MSRPRPTRRLAVLAVVCVAVAGLSLASAAQVGVSARVLQAGVGAVSSCQPATRPVAVSFTSAYASGAYTATAVTFSNLDPACGGLVLRTRVLGSAGTTQRGELSGTVPAGGGSLTLSFAALTVTSIASVAAVIS